MQADEHHTSTRLVPPHDSRREGADDEPAEGPHEQIKVSCVRAIGVEDAEQEQAHGSRQPGQQRDEASALAPPRVVREAVEPGRVAHVVDGEDGAEEADASRGAAGDEGGLERLRADVADERHVRVHLARVPRPAEREPAEQQHREGREPERAREEREQPELAVRDDVAEGVEPEPCHVLTTIRLWFGGESRD